MNRGIQKKAEIKEYTSCVRSLENMQKFLTNMTHEFQRYPASSNSAFLKKAAEI